MLKLIIFVCTLALLTPQPHTTTDKQIPYRPELIKPIAQIEPRPVEPLLTVETEPAPPPQTYQGTGDYYLDWIIQHESSGNPYAINEIGACGLGQSLPCSKLLNVCGSLDDIQCQIDFFRNYCASAYGSTYNAYLFWLAHNWY